MSFCTNDIMCCCLSLLCSLLISNTKKGRLNQTLDYCGWDTVNKQAQYNGKPSCDALQTRDKDLRMQNFI